MLKSLMEQLVAVGADPEQVKAVLEKNSGAIKVEDRPAWIMELNSIKEVRLAYKRSHAKKAKPSKPETRERYLAEIEAAKTRLNELLAIVELEEDPISKIHKALELEEEPGKVYHSYVLPVLESAPTEVLDTLFKDQSKATRKSLIMKVPSHVGPTIMEFLEQFNCEALVETHIERSEKDQRVLVINRMWNLAFPKSDK